MSTLIISWDDEKIVEIEKRGELFYSSVNYENVLRAKEKGRSTNEATTQNDTNSIDERSAVVK